MIVCTASTFFALPDFCIYLSSSSYVLRMRWCWLAFLCIIPSHAHYHSETERRSLLSHKAMAPCLSLLYLSQLQRIYSAFSLPVYLFGSHCSEYRSQDPLDATQNFKKLLLAERILVLTLVKVYISRTYHGGPDGLLGVIDSLATTGATSLYGSSRWGTNMDFSRPVAWGVKMKNALLICIFEKVQFTKSKKFTCSMI